VLVYRSPNRRQRGIRTVNRLDHLASLLEAGKTHKPLISDEGGFFPAPDVEPMPHYFQAICPCGWQDKTYHGADHIKESCERHIFAEAHLIEMSPGGATLGPKR
jgi:hypothetical protein